MPSRQQTMADAIRAFEHADYPSGLNALTAWLGIYQVLLWYEPVNWLEFTYLPHIIDADKLRPASPARRQNWSAASAWQRRAQLLNAHLAEQLFCSIDNLPHKTDTLMKQPGYEGLQRQNILGTGFVGLIRHVLEGFGALDLSYETEVEAAAVFPGITVPGRSATPRIDILARRHDIPVAIVSAKWSIRHDRLGDITNECPVYKAAYQRIYRQAQRHGLLYYVVTNEYDPARLNKILDDSCVNGVVHVHKKAVVEICDLDGRLARLTDLASFIRSTSTW